MATLVEQLLKEEVDKKFTPEKQIELFGTLQPDRKQMALSLAGKLSKQQGMEPGDYSSPLTILGIDVFGKGKEYAKRRKLEQEQAEHMKAIDLLDLELGLGEKLKRHAKLQEAEQFTGRDFGQLPKDSQQHLIDQGQAPTKTVEVPTPLARLPPP